jgi:hypothetical protein
VRAVVLSAKKWSPRSNLVWGKPIHQERRAKNKRRKPTKKIGPAAATEQDRVKTGEWKKLRSNDTKSKWCKTHSTNEIKKPTFPLKSKIEFLAH